MRETLRDIQLGVPFSTVGTVLIAGGDATPMRLGRNCVGQSRALANELSLKGYNPQFVALARDTGIHYAVVVRDGDSYFLDPSSLHDEPMNLTGLFRSRISTLVDSYPIVKRMPAKLLFESTSQRKFTLTKNVFDGRAYEERFRYEFDLNTLSNTLPRDDDPYLASFGKDRLVLRTLDEEGSTTTLTHMFNLSLRQTRKSSMDGIVEAAFPHHDGNFMQDPHFEEVSDRLLMHPRELLAYFDRAARVFSYVQALAA